MQSVVAKAAEASLQSCDPPAIPLPLGPNGGVPLPQEVNRLRNADFSHGKTAPSGWVLQAERARWERPAGAKIAAAGITAISDDAAGSAIWSQVVVCKPGEHYRVEAVVCCDLTAADDSAGFVLAIQPLKDDRLVGTRLVTPALHRVSNPITVRAFYEAPADVRRLEFSVGLVDARGTACIREARFIWILEPEEQSHVLSVPPPPYTVTPPRQAREIVICSQEAATRPITRRLRGYFGDRHVRVASPTELKPSAGGEDALLLPDATPPPAIRSVSGLAGLARDRIIVISLPAFCKLANGKLSVRRVVQPDEPIAAKIAFANYATCGFALHDVFPYAWEGKSAGSFVQNQFRKLGTFKLFCKRHGLETLLISECNKDSTSERPISLHLSTPRGGLFVLDIEPAEQDGSTMDEPALAMHLLLSILGHTQVGIGQYAVPFREEKELRSHIREMGHCFTEIFVHDADAPVEEVTEQLVTVGRDDESFGLPLRPKPVILVRSGLASGDVESVLGSWLWFKQLIRPEPFRCPYADLLASRFRLAWVPCVAPWEARDGWRRSDGEPTQPMAVETRDTTIAALIDVVSRPIHRTRVVLPSDKGAYDRYVQWLPMLSRAFASRQLFLPEAADGDTLADRDRVSWRRITPDVQVEADADSFDTDAHRDVLDTGGEVIRIELPGCHAGFAAHSIQRNDQAATLLEHVIGLQIGLLAVNRLRTPVQLDGFPPVVPGDALMVDRRDAMLQATGSRAG